MNIFSLLVAIYNQQTGFNTRLCKIEKDTAAILAAVSPDPNAVEKVLGVSDFTVTNNKALQMTQSASSPPINNNQTVGFNLNGIVPAGGSFSEPKVVEIAGTTPQGTIEQSASVQGTPNPDGSVPFTTACTYKNAAFVGTTTLNCEVLGVDNFDIDIPISATPNETILGVTNFTVVNNS